uniref:Interleukin-3 receptor class 2 subunit beta-like n=1 Tax=Sinocyclocheilus grahami TaxID=75366 RepID=A0A672RWH8_SINGR
MFCTWILHMVGFALLVRGGISDDKCPHHEVKPGKDSAVLDSLQCHNDYMSYAQCTWEVDPQVHPQENTHELSLTCAAITLRASLAWKSLSPLCVCVCVISGKVKAPIDLTERVADGGGRLLSWRSPYPVSSNITGTLVYQLQYRRYMHDWTIVDNTSASEYMIDKESLLSGYRYQARVRARGPVGLWSDWSPLVSWKTHNDGAFNLQCVIAGETNVTCTWQMKTEHYQFMSYHLCLSVCCEDPQLKSRDVELSEFMCLVKTLDPYLLTVELRQVYYARTFRTSKHIKLSQPDQIHVKEGDGVFILNWSKPVVSTDIQFSIQLKFSTNKTSEIFTLSEGESNFDLYFTNLHPSTEYQAQIRLLPEPDDTYVIEPSEWSQPVVFKIKPGNALISDVSCIDYRNCLFEFKSRNLYVNTPARIKCGGRNYISLKLNIKNAAKVLHSNINKVTCSLSFLLFDWEKFKGRRVLSLCYLRVYV